MNTREKVLVTGASGFVGSAVAHKLVEAGYSVRALVRERGPYSNLADLDIEFLKGDLRDRELINRAVAGTRYVFHVAADYRLWAPNPDEIFATNVEGTRNVMEAALDAGVERVVHTSSVATIALRPGEVADESTPLPESEAIGAYKRSKIAAERLVELHGDRARPSRGHRQSLDADRTARRTAHADRPHYRGSRQGSDSGIRRYGAQPRPCR